MITAMCAAQGVEVNPTMKIREAIDKKYIRLYCTNPDESGEHAFGVAPGGDYIPEAGPSGPANDVVDAGDGEGLYHDGDFEEDFDKIMRGD
ncbi:hypothetical protein SESBI_36919 [Sesbania bispinosa]|nr:hypothetical protein SESBI_36919 [Sesbania bispinosa]